MGHSDGDVAVGAYDGFGEPVASREDGGGSAAPTGPSEARAASAGLSAGGGEPEEALYVDGATPVRLTRVEQQLLGSDDDHTASLIAEVAQRMTTVRQLQAALLQTLSSPPPTERSGRRTGTAADDEDEDEEGEEEEEAGGRYSPLPQALGGPPRSRTRGLELV